MISSCLYAVCSLNSPGRHFLTHLEVKRKGKKLSPNINPKLKNISRKCWSWEPRYCGNLSLPSSPLREEPLLELVASQMCLNHKVHSTSTCIERESWTGHGPVSWECHLHAIYWFIWIHLQPTSSGEGRESQSFLAGKSLSEKVGNYLVSTRKRGYRALLRHFCAADILLNKHFWHFFFQG